MKKYVSIFGDSISTLYGWNPKDYSVFFEGENCEHSGVKDYSDTWWGQLIEYLEANLLVNDSWSGSRVTKLPNYYRLFPSGISDERINNLKKLHRNPDIIVIQLGVNDWGFGVDLLSQKPNGNERNKFVFRDAYSMMLEKLRSKIKVSEGADLLRYSVFDIYANGAGNSFSQGAVRKQYRVL